MRVAVLDLGSNSFHLLVADAVNDGTVSPVLREREMLHLGGVVAERGAIPQEALTEAVDTVTHFAELARRTSCDVTYAVATSAIRDAANSREVLAALEATTGAPIRILDGDEEARLGYLGVRASIALGDEPVLVLDLGGGSLELAFGVGEEVRWTASVDLGVSRLRAELVRNDPVSKAERKALHDRIDRTIEPLLAHVSPDSGAQTVAVGGTVRALARVVAVENDVWLPNSINQLTVTLQDLELLRDRLLKLDVRQRSDVPGLKSRRADHIHVAAVILCRTLSRLAVDRITVSDWGLREGVILDAFHVHDLPRGEQLRRGAVLRLRDAFVPDDPHLDHVAELAVQLFDATQVLHGRGRDDRELLRYGALLHDLGERIALRGHHKHSAYLIENAELRGFSPHEVATLATLARFHRRGAPRPDYPPYAALDDAERTRAHELLALLQLADGLDRARDQAIAQVQARVRRGTVTLILHGRRTDLARVEVERKADLFERTFGHRVIVAER